MTGAAVAKMDGMTGERVLGLLGVLLTQVAGLGLLVFWAMGAVLLLTNNGGQITELELTGLERAFYLLYPVFLVVFSALGWLLFWVRRDLLANLTMAAPVGLMVLFYLYLILR